MRITIILPSYPTLPIGGFKVVYEHANGLAARGHSITLIHPRTIAASPSRVDRLKAHLWPAKIRLRNRGASPAWFRLDRSVDLRLPRSLADCRPPDADVLMATAWQTARWVASQSPAKGEKFYFVHGYEYWANATPAERRDIGETFQLGLRHVALSNVVKSMLQDCGARAEALIRPGINHDVFRLCQPIESREPASVVFPLRREPFKGTDDAVTALALAREKLGRPLRAIGFGSAVPDQYPSWLEVARTPTDDQLCQLLNSVAIFVLPSHFEGFGLPGLEAMACGAALVSTDSGGVREYARPDETAILVPPHDPEHLAESIVSMIVDDDGRRALAERGLAEARRARWDRAIDQMDAALTSFI